MAYNLEFHPVAKEELWDAVDWYDSQKTKLGRELAKALQKVMQMIRSHPTRFPKIRREIRKAVLKRFPYVVIFEIQEDTIFVLSIFHTSRNPKIWKERSLN